MKNHDAFLSETYTKHVIVDLCMRSVLHSYTHRQPIVNFIALYLWDAAIWRRFNILYRAVCVGENMENSRLTLKRQVSPLFG